MLGFLLGRCSPTVRSHDDGFANTNSVCESRNLLNNLYVNWLGMKLRVNHRLKLMTFAFNGDQRIHLPIPASDSIRNADIVLNNAGSFVLLVKESDSFLIFLPCH